MLYLSAITPVKIQFCGCTHPAIALIRQGAFTSTPVKAPKWAFNLQYLSFVREQFLAGVPNYSAWCSATVAFLQKQGCPEVPSEVSWQRINIYIYLTSHISSQHLLGLYHHHCSTTKLSKIESALW